MARRCPITQKGVQTGNNVSHANNRTRRRFLPNIQPVTLHSEALGQSFQMRVSASGLRTVEHKGGFDQFLLSTPKSKLTPELAKLRSRVEAKISA